MADDFVAVPFAILFCISNISTAFRRILHFGSLCFSFFALANSKRVLITCSKPRYVRATATAEYQLVLKQNQETLFDFEVLLKWSYNKIDARKCNTNGKLHWVNESNSDKRLTLKALFRSVTDLVARSN